jgi:ribosomal-protein-serine acetyltransferase
MFEIRVSDELVLRQCEVADTAAMFALVDANRESYGKWLGFVYDLQTVEDMREFIERYVERWEKREALLISVWFRGQLAGGMVYRLFDWRHQMTEIGYWLDAAFQGKGIVTAGSRALIDYAFGELGMHRVEIRAARENRPSRAVAERLGFAQEGIMRETYHLNSGYLDMVVYGLLAHEWELQRTSGT